jgi:hypothetical protein
LFLKEELKCTVSLSSGFLLAHGKAFRRKKKFALGDYDGGRGGALLVTESAHLKYRL